MTGKALDVGIFTGLAFLPRLFSSVYGIVVDRVDQRDAFAISLVAIGLLVAGLSLAADVALIYALWFLLSVLVAFSQNARTVLMTRVMPANGYLWVIPSSSSFSTPRGSSSPS